MRLKGNHFSEPYVVFIVIVKNILYVAVFSGEKRTDTLKNSPE